VSAFSLRGGTIAILNTKDGLAVVDTQYADTAKVCLDGIRAKSPRTIDLVVNTHHHGDHTSGNGVLRAAAQRIVAHENSAALQRKAAAATPAPGGAPAPSPTFPDETYTDTWSDTVGDERVALQYYGPGHTSGDSVVTFETANVVHMGDLMFNRMHGFVDVASGASITNWASVLDKTLKAHHRDTMYIFGHGKDGKVTGSGADLEEFRDYLLALMSAAHDAVKKGTARDEFVKGTLAARFADYGTPVANNPNFSLAGNLGKAFDEASKK
jgi:cyclase